MEQAVQVMRDSVAETRADGKATPKVGAVLLKPDGSVETAYRGEIRAGDHAEYTLIERKNRDEPLDGSVLFATLEPCTDHARSESKRGCSTRIVDARIETVYVGIEDPDPTVATAGIAYLQDHGVRVEMFDRDLQTVIEQENAGFLDQATQRADDAESVPPPPRGTLGALVAGVGLDALSTEALALFREKAGIEPQVGTGPFWDRLEAAGLLRLDDLGVLGPTGAGLLLFGERPRDVFRQSALVAKILYPDGSQGHETFDGPLLLVPGRAMRWLRDKLPNVIDRTEAHRREVPPLPFDVVREAIVNALVHRDYGVEGAKCHLVVTTDTVVVKSPGQPPEPVTLAQMQAFKPPALSRNPALHFVFAQAGLAEEAGFGVPTLRDRARELGLPLPSYAYEPPNLVLTLYRHSDAVVAALPEAVRDAFSSTEHDGWVWLSRHRAVSRSEYEQALDLPGRTARNHLKHFVELGLLDVVGQGPSTRYVVRLQGP